MGDVFWVFVIVCCMFCCGAGVLSQFECVVWGLVVFFVVVCCFGFLMFFCGGVFVLWCFFLCVGLIFFVLKTVWGGFVFLCFLWLYALSWVFWCYCSGFGFFSLMFSFFCNSKFACLPICFF